MPWKLVPPRAPHTKFWYVRGKYCGIGVDRSTGTSDEAAAKRILATWRKQAERGEFSKEEGGPTFLTAATAYLHAGGSNKHLRPILERWRKKPLEEIDQVAIDALAVKLYPNGTPATRNRQVYTPVMAILHHVGVDRRFRRPQGAQGKKRTFWLRPPETFRLLDAATEVDPELGILCTLLNYTGLRLGEALALLVRDVDLARQFAYIPNTKTGEPRGVHLPPVVVAALANHPRGLSRDGTVFRFHHRSGDLTAMLKVAAKRAGIDLPVRTAYHLFRHNYGTWMRQYAGLDELGLTRTGAWADRHSVARYSHSEPHAEARRADALPTPGRGAGVEKKSGGN